MVLHQECPQRSGRRPPWFWLHPSATSSFCLDRACHSTNRKCAKLLGIINRTKKFESNRVSEREGEGEQFACLSVGLRTQVFVGWGKGDGSAVLVRHARAKARLQRLVQQSIRARRRTSSITTLRLWANFPRRVALRACGTGAPTRVDRLPPPKLSRDGSRAGRRLVQIVGQTELGSCYCNGSRIQMSRLKVRDRHLSIDDHARCTVVSNRPRARTPRRMSGGGGEIGRETTNDGYGLKTKTVPARIRRASTLICRATSAGKQECNPSRQCLQATVVAWG